MAWQVLHPIDSGEILFKPFLTATRLAVRVDKNLTIPPTWNRVGFLIPTILINGYYYDGKPQAIGFGGQIIDIPFSRYQIRFSPVDWMKRSLNLYLRISENMGINFPTNSSLIGEEQTSVIATSISAIPIRTANPTFSEGFIVNNSTKGLYVRFAATPLVTATAPNILVPAKGNIDIPENFTGVIQGIWTGNDASGKAEIHEFNYL